tara:strand:- start:702 stop:3785 length:3084 start_codon:yes stop_codon:yes gene_type:complete
MVNFTKLFIPEHNSFIFVFLGKLGIKSNNEVYIHEYKDRTGVRIFLKNKDESSIKDFMIKFNKGDVLSRVAIFTKMVQLNDNNFKESLKTHIRNKKCLFVKHSTYTTEFEPKQITESSKSKKNNLGLNVHQLRTVSKFTYNEGYKLNQIGGLVYHEVGTGKTMTGLSWIVAMQYHVMTRVVVILPNNLINNWINESTKTTVPNSALHNGFRKMLPNIYYISFDDLMNELVSGNAEDSCSNLSDLLTDSLIVVDEAHYLVRFMNSKNITDYRKTILFNALRSCNRILLLTGTPLYDGEKDIVYLLNLISIEGKIKGEPLLPFSKDLFIKEFYKINYIKSIFFGWVVPLLDNPITKMFSIAFTSGILIDIIVRFKEHATYTAQSGTYTKNRKGKIIHKKNEETLEEDRETYDENVKGSFSYKYLDSIAKLLGISAGIGTTTGIITAGAAPVVGLVGFFSILSVLSKYDLNKTKYLDTKKFGLYISDFVDYQRQIIKSSKNNSSYSSFPNKKINNVKVHYTPGQIRYFFDLSIGSISEGELDEISELNQDINTRCEAFSNRDFESIFNEISENDKFLKNGRAIGNLTKSEYTNTFSSDIFKEIDKPHPKRIIEIINKKTNEKTIVKYLLLNLLCDTSNQCRTCARVRSEYNIQEKDDSYEYPGKFMSVVERIIKGESVTPSVIYSNYFGAGVVKFDEFITHIQHQLLVYEKNNVLSKDKLGYLRYERSKMKMDGSLGYKGEIVDLHTKDVKKILTLRTGFLEHESYNSINKDIFSKNEMTSCNCRFCVKPILRSKYVLSRFVRISWLKMHNKANSDISDAAIIRTINQLQKKKISKSDVISAFKEIDINELEPDNLAINILLLHPKHTEGINIPYAGQLHILEPIENPSLREQVYGRVTRFCQTDIIPCYPNKFNVEIFNYKCKINAFVDHLGRKLKHWMKNGTHRIFWKRYVKFDQDVTPDTLTHVKCMNLEKLIDSFKMGLEKSLNSKKKKKSFLNRLNIPKTKTKKSIKKNQQAKTKKNPVKVPNKR